MYIYLGTALLNEVDEVRIRKVRCSCKQEHQRAKANNVCLASICLCCNVIHVLYIIAIN